MDFFRDTLTDINKMKAASISELIFLSTDTIEERIQARNQIFIQKAITKHAFKDHFKNREEYLHEHKDYHKKQIKHHWKLKSDKQSHDHPTNHSILCLPSQRLQERDQEISFQVHLLLAKSKPIFKIDGVKRKIKNYLKRSMNKECPCCRKSMYKHKCLHKTCDENCEKHKQNEEKKKIISLEDILMKDVKINNENINKDFIDFVDKELVESKQQIINEQEKSEENNIKIIKIRKFSEKLDETLIPKINMIVEQQQSQLMQDGADLIQRDRISEIQSKSEVSESRRNKNSQIQSHSQISQLQPENLREDLQKNVQNTIFENEFPKKDVSQQKKSSFHLILEYNKKLSQNQSDSKNSQ